ncbi:hypothetical protein [Phenylobacterium sp.]|jgi:hypothetical protein|uniref:hypothetical protein n=1 Tax=Phenylobacterium sp. TaxID=1871053 RepID=UPI002E2F2C2A|nr:hypothetical protein [Phenylobacterium sp.]HEX3366949.1 hypothetical protein [Phenylobacterium sp.]
MTTPHDVVPATESLTFSKADGSRRDEDRDLASLAQEINERRARVENAELLQHLRGL